MLTQIVGDTYKDGVILEDDNILKLDLYTMHEIVLLKNKYNIREVIVTHLEEDWGKSFDDYLEIEKTYENIKFAYDGMIIEI